MKLLTEIKVKLKYTEKDIYAQIEKKYHLKKDEILSYLILRESLDARKKPNIIISLNIAVDVTEKVKQKLKACKDLVPLTKGLEYPRLAIKTKRPIIVGFGPAGCLALDQQPFHDCVGYL